ncbi:MAG: MaoC family dehydratase [Rhodospirillales bacterium]|nr:MaoC family dehydratase [Rhodospirillales bacterium]
MTISTRQDQVTMRYFEDFAPGDEFDLGTCRITRKDIVAFARQFDPQPFHVDERAAADSIYGGIIASGWHTISLYMRLFVEGLLHNAASLGSPGVDKVRWRHPVRPDDVLTAKATVQEVTPSRSRPERGNVRWAYEMRNQDGVVVMTMEGIGMFQRKR